MAVVAWTVVPLVALHVWFWRTRRPLFRFQLLVDVGLAVVVGQALVLGSDLNPIRCVQNTPPYDSWEWSRRTDLQPTQSDVALQFHPWWAETREQLLQGRLPAVCQYIGGGLPLLANGQTGLWAPVMAPVWVLGPERGTTVMAFWKLELAAVGAFLFLWKRWRVHWRGAAVGGLALGIGCYQVAWLLVPLSWVTAATPWLWWAVEHSLRRRSGVWTAAAVGVALGWLVGCGLHPETAVVVVGSAVLAGIVLHPRRWLRLVVMLVVAVPVACALMWPTIGYIAGSARLQVTRQERPNLEPLPVHVRLAAFKQLLVPSIHGHPARGDWRAPYPHAPAATGAGGVVIALLAAGGVRRRYRRLLWAALACLAAALVVAYRLPPLDALAVRLPPIDRMTLPRFAALVPWSLAVWAAVAADGLVGGCRRGAGWRFGAVVVLAVVAVSGAPWLLAPADLGLVVLAVALAAGVAVAARSAVWLAPAVAVELGLLAVGINPVADPADRTPRPALVAAIESAARAEEGRLLGIGGTLPPNLAGRHGVSDLRAFDPLRPQPFATMLGLLGEPEPVLGGALDVAPPGLCGAWSVRSLVTPPGAQAPGWDLVFKDRSGALWRNPEWLPEVRLVGRTVEAAGERGRTLLLSETVDFATTAVVVSGAPPTRADTVILDEVQTQSTGIRARVSCDGPCLLVVARPWAPGWRALVDGREVAVALANVAGMGVPVPEGEHRVELRYNPWRWVGRSELNVER